MDSSLLPSFSCSWVSQLQVAPRYAGGGGGEEVPGKEEGKEFPGNNVETVTADEDSQQEQLAPVRSTSGRVTELNTQEEGTGDLAFSPESLPVREF